MRRRYAFGGMAFGVYLLLFLGLAVFLVMGLYESDDLSVLDPGEYVFDDPIVSGLEKTGTWGHLSIVYDLPKNTDSVVWEVKHGPGALHEYNISVPTSCIGRNVSFRLSSRTNGGWASSGSCFDGSSYVRLTEQRSNPTSGGGGNHINNQGVVFDGNFATGACYVPDTRSESFGGSIENSVFGSCPDQYEAVWWEERLYVMVGGGS